MVRATDPAGMPGGSALSTRTADTVTVNIMVTDVNEAPDIHRRWLQ